MTWKEGTKSLSCEYQVIWAWREMKKLTNCGRKKQSLHSLGQNLSVASENIFLKGKSKRWQKWIDHNSRRIREDWGRLRNFSGTWTSVGPGFAKASWRRVSVADRISNRHCTLDKRHLHKLGIVNDAFCKFCGWRRNFKTRANELWYDYGHESKKLQCASNYFGWRT